MYYSYSVKLPEPVQHTINEGFSFLYDLALPIGIGITVTVVSGIILFLARKKLQRLKK